MANAIRLMWIHGHDLNATLLEILHSIAQLRELSLADLSGVSIDEHEHYGFLPAPIAELMLLPFWIR